MSATEPTSTETTTGAQPELVEEMFVQTARGASSGGGRLTLTGLGPHTLYFSDRPERVVGHMTNDAFTALWTAPEGEGHDSDGFATDPPNAVLSFIDVGGDRPEDCVMVLRDPQPIASDGAGGTSVSYAIDLLQGTVPEATGACTLFIDPLGRPLSPMSVAGVRRRERRRR